MPWVLNASDEINAQSKHPTIIAVCVILTLLMTAVAFLRVYVHLQAGQLRADDNVIVATMVTTPFVSFICDYLFARRKLKPHIPSVPQIFAIVYAALAIARKLSSFKDDFGLRNGMIKALSQKQGTGSVCR